MITPVILSGGSGTRLWPLSTAERPKQFLPLVGEESLFHQTLARVSDRSVYAAPIIVANAVHEALCREEIATIAGARLVLEPVARNTAVAIAMAAAVAAETDRETILLVMPSDHRIGNEAAFHEAVQRGAGAASKNHLVTFGIQPTGPETGYGYLQAGDQRPGLDHVSVVASFKEKPDAESAKAMLAAGSHYWNGGIFMFRADHFLEECRQLAPDVYRASLAAVAARQEEGDVVRPESGPLEACPDISVDYAVMERSSAIAMVPLDADWSDVGSWDALADLATKIGEAQVPSLDSSNCYVRTDSGHKVALLGVEDLIVVLTDKQLVIMKRGRSQDIKRLAGAVNVG